MSEAAVFELITMLETQPEPSDEEWYSQALCPQTDPDAFFPEKGGSTKDAKAVCVRCPVTKECLQWALANDESGVWGGLTERERRRLKRDAGPGEPIEDNAERHTIPTIVAKADGYDGARLAG